MGWFNKLLGGGQTKVDLIRSLAKKRLTGDVLASAAGATPEVIDKLTPEAVFGLPEGTIVAIVEAWAQGRSKRMPERQIFEIIEAHRAAAFQRIEGPRSMVAQGQFPTSPTLNSYVRYRVDLEYGRTSAPISAAHMQDCLREAMQFFGPITD